MNAPRPTVSPRPFLEALGWTGGNVLTIGGVPAPDLAARFGTPLYAHDAGCLRESLAAVRAALGPDIAIDYALKANPLVAVARVFAAAGTGCDIASLGEGKIAYIAGFAPKDLRFAGPGKSAHELAWARTEGIGRLHLEGARELALLAAESASAAPPLPVAVRVNPTATVARVGLRMGGGPAPFGTDEDRVPDLLRAVAATQCLALSGVHQYLGTQCLDAGTFIAAADHLLQLVTAWERDIDRPLPHVTLGGGFGVPLAGEDPLDLEALGRGLQGLVAAAPERTYAVELGRYLTAPAGVYLTRVLEVKHSGGGTFALVDGGLHHAAAAAGFGQVLRRSWPVVTTERMAAARAGRVTLCGPLCTAQDRLGSPSLPRLRPGDLLAVLAMGAYGLTFSPLRFLSHPAPAEVVVDGGAAALARRRGDPGDGIADQVLDGGAP